jgi:hypothetical protein
LSEGRRHLTLREADLALKRGRPVEMLLGAVGERGIRFAQIAETRDGVTVQVHEMHRTSADFLDLYEATPLDGDNPEGVVFERTFERLEALIADLKVRYPDQTLAMVNFGVLADEYLDFLKHSR